MVTKEVFTSLNLPIMAINLSKGNKYQVFSDNKEFILVEAENAAIAIEKSKIQQPYKIIHVINDLIDFIDKSQLVIEEDPISTPDTPPAPDTMN